MSILDHPIVSQRYFLPRQEAPPDVLRVDCGSATLACHAERPHADGLTAVFFHGNGELVADYHPWFCDALTSRGLNALLAEYRGYGASTGSPCLVGMLADVEPIFGACELPEERLLVYGRSVGSIYAIELAARHPGVAGLVLESGIADPLERILLRVHPAELGASPEEVAAAAAKDLDHEHKLRAYRGPLLVLHARHDTLVDVSHGERLASWGEPSQTELVVLPEGDHNSVMMASWAAYWVAVDGFLERVR